MSDRREEILKNQVGSYAFDELIDKEPGVITAMDEYMKECCLSLLQYVAENTTDSSVSVNGVEFKYKGEWISKEQLFENFL